MTRNERTLLIVICLVVVVSLKGCAAWLDEHQAMTEVERQIFEERMITPW